MADYYIQEVEQGVFKVYERSTFLWFFDSWDPVQGAEYGYGYDETWETFEEAQAWIQKQADSDLRHVKRIAKEAQFQRNKPAPKYFRTIDGKVIAVEQPKEENAS